MDTRQTTPRPNLRQTHSCALIRVRSHANSKRIHITAQKKHRETQAKAHPRKREDVNGRRSTSKGSRFLLKYCATGTLFSTGIVADRNRPSPAKTEMSLKQPSTEAARTQHVGNTKSRPSTTTNKSRCTLYHDTPTLPTSQETPYAWWLLP